MCAVLKSVLHLRFSADSHLYFQGIMSNVNVVISANEIVSTKKNHVSLKSANRQYIPSFPQHLFHHTFVTTVAYAYLKFCQLQLQ